MAWVAGLCAHANPTVDGPVRCSWARRRVLKSEHQHEIIGLAREAAERVAKALY
ncbi:hypothetical protein [Sinomonas atrocyanea]|uniref:hypothetical protein n=1 Tax=Sinomonas atrocyanea TaxID=37927 RepID=UPI003D95CD85